ncbi:3-deoxy-D-manno-octulosonic acid transferase [Acinetobacter sp. WZC-1]|uniref:3-deoxy-D-manno-octulosonic acid transferase n=1 Tax=Acinetobacter sp. WZC-1 TaxID=3459034 RepID=UPI00403E2486
MATPFWYNAALSIIKPLYKWRIKKRALNMAQYHQECVERFGPFQPALNKNVIWFHAVSVGETNAAQPLIEHYLNAGHAVLVTNTTTTGQARARALFLKACYERLFQAVYLPADQVQLLRTFYEKYQPRLLILVETELWPNLINQARQLHVPCLLINARLSEKSARGYARVPGLTRSMLQGLDYLLAQDQVSQQRFIELGMPPQKTIVAGSIKFDIQAPEQFLLQAHQLQQDWQLASRKIITIASTHAPEEQKLLSALKADFMDHPELLCIVVPRHPERFDEVFQLAQSLNLRTRRRSRGESIQQDTQVYLADSMGELWLWYALSQACFVGGSLNTPGGGHNLLEPMVLQVPTVTGPHYFNFQSIVDAFLQADAVRVATDAEQAAEWLRQYLNDKQLAARLVTHANAVLEQNKGSLYRHIQMINSYL